MSLWPLLFIFFAFADEDFSYERYCFSSPSEAAKAQQNFKAIQVASDSVDTSSNCLTIQMRPHRRELIQRYFKSIFPNINVSFSSAEIKRDPCLLKVEKEEVSTGKQTTIDISNSSSISQSTNIGTAKETLKIQTNSDFELRVDEDEIKGVCRVINPSRYEVTITVQKYPAQIIPDGLPPGSIVVLNGSPPDQKTSRLTTTIQLGRNERIELGTVIKDLRNRNKAASIEPKIRNVLASETSREKVFLSLD